MDEGRAEEDQGPPEDLAHQTPAGPVELVTGLSRAYMGVLAWMGFVALFVVILLWGSNRPANPTFADTTATTVAGPWAFPAEAFTDEAFDAIAFC